MITIVFASIGGISSVNSSHILWKSRSGWGLKNSEVQLRPLYIGAAARLGGDDSMRKSREDGNNVDAAFAGWSATVYYDKQYVLAPTPQRPKTNPAGEAPITMEAHFQMWVTGSK